MVVCVVLWSLAYQQQFTPIISWRFLVFIWFCTGKRSLQRTTTCTIAHTADTQNNYENENLLLPNEALPNDRRRTLTFGGGVSSWDARVDRCLSLVCVVVSNGSELVRCESKTVFVSSDRTLQIFQKCMAMMKTTRETRPSAFRAKEMARSGIERCRKRGASSHISPHIQGDIEAATIGRAKITKNTKYWRQRC